jgi:hypothetical protein
MTITTCPPHAPRAAALAIAALVALTGACDDGPTAPDRTAQAVATLRRVTERYHDLNAAKGDGFVFLHGCESRPGAGAVGMLYVHMDRLADGKVDPEKPDALVYEPIGANGANGATLVGVEFAVPYTAWTGQRPPEFLGVPFQPEDEFGVFGLHVWVWRDNPNGLFAEANPRVTC